MLGYDGMHVRLQEDLELLDDSPSSVRHDHSTFDICIE